MSALKITACLRCTKGNEKGKVLYDENGKIESENQKISFTYKDISWSGHIQRLPKMGFAKIELESVYEGDKESKDDDLFNEITESIKSLLTAPKEELTPQEQRIADLEAKIEALTKGATKAPIEPKAQDNDEALDALRAEFKAKAGKEAHKLWGEKRLSEEIAKLNN